MELHHTCRRGPSLAVGGTSRSVEDGCRRLNVAQRESNAYQRSAGKTLEELCAVTGGWCEGGMMYPIGVGFDLDRRGRCYGVVKDSREWECEGFHSRGGGFDRQIPCFIVVG